MIGQAWYGERITTADNPSIALVPLMADHVHAVVVMPVHNKESRRRNNSLPIDSKSPPLRGAWTDQHHRMEGRRGDRTLHPARSGSLSLARRSASDSRRRDRSVEVPFLFRSWPLTVDRPYVSVNGARLNSFTSSSGTHP